MNPQLKIFVRKKPIKDRWWFNALIAIAICLLYSAYVGNASAQELKPVEIDPKDHYPRYVIEGPLNEHEWNVDHTIYNRDDLVKELPFVKEEDVNTRFRCEFLCADQEGYVTGINPKFKWMKKKD